MPRVRPKTADLGALVYGTARIKGVNQYQMAEMANVSQSTIYNHKRDIGHMRLNNLLSLSNRLGIPIETFRANIHY